MRFFWQKKKCKHEFDMCDLYSTGIKLKEPKTKGYEEWEKYYEIKNSGEHISHTHRVLWACSKCGEVFNAECGLDIIGEHGKMVNGLDNVMRKI